MTLHSRAVRIIAGAIIAALGGMAPLFSVDSAPTPAFGNRVITEAAKRLRPAVVHIRVKIKTSESGGLTGFFGPRKRESQPASPFFSSKEPVQLGSGVIISEDGYIITNHHVIKNAASIQLKFHDGDESSAEVIGVDDKTDLALLKAKSDQKLSPAPMGNSDSLDVGEWVIAIGSPFGLPQSVSVGIVSGLGRDLGQGPYDDYIQTDAAINPGNSGGPLANSQGEVIGINTAIFSRGRRLREVGVGFAIPINQVKRVVDDLRHKGYPVRGRLGVSVGSVSPDESKKLGLPRFRGAKLSEVIRGGPADKAGLQRGDVVVEFNGKTVVTWQTLPRLVARARPDEDADVKFYRKGNLKSLRVRLGSRTEAPVRKKDGNWGLLGMRLETLTPQIASRFQISSPASGKGLIVSAVKRGGPAERGGVRAGDRLKEVNHTPVTTHSEFQKALDRHGTDGHLLLLLQRRDSDIFAAIQFQ